MSSPTATAIFCWLCELASPAAEVQYNGQVYYNGNGVQKLYYNGLRNPRSGLFTLTSVYQVPGSRYLPCQFDLKYVLIKCTSIQIDQSQSQSKSQYKRKYFDVSSYKEMVHNIRLWVKFSPDKRCKLPNQNSAMKNINSIIDLWLS